MAREQGLQGLLRPSLEGHITHTGTIAQNKACIRPKFKRKGNRLHLLREGMTKSFHKRSWDKLLQHL